MNKGKIANHENSGTDGLGIDWAFAGLTNIRLETAKITTRTNEKPLLKLPMLTIRNGLQIKGLAAQGFGMV